VRIPTAASLPPCASAKRKRSVTQGKRGGLCQQQYDLARRSASRTADRRRDQKASRRMADRPGARQTDVKKEDIAEVVAMWTGIPVVQIATRN